ncbi:hypothetical protein GCM10009760_00660 [Kitasatospora kazusensis]|uniref:Uncharacterized protein n=1 Tax=Kitasatospora kazusensis TaxID=407974 RepID=A0ABP5KE71_9ACTN
MPIAEDPERPSDGPQDDPFAGLVLDEEFVKGATVKEQSGRARMLAAKWQREPPEPVPHRHDPVKPVNLATRRRRRSLRRLGARLGRGWQTVLIVACVIGLALLGLQMGGKAQAPQRPVVLQPPETAAPTAPPSAAPGTASVDHPWDGSPALSWPEGAAGIAVPDALAVGTFGKDEVAAQLKTVKSFLVAANIDPQTVAGTTPQAALDLLDVSSRTAVEKSLAHPTEADDPTNYFSRFNPRLSIPVTATVKVQGRMTFEGDGDKGVLVHTDYTFVYALRPGPDVGKSPSAAPGAPHGSAPADTKAVSWLTGVGGPEVEREIVRRTQDFRFYDPARYAANPAKLTLDKGLSDFSDNVCTMGDGFLETSFADSAAGTEKPSTEAPTDPYDHSHPLAPGGEGCGSLTRS